MRILCPGSYLERPRQLKIFFHENLSSWATNIHRMPGKQKNRENYLPSVSACHCVGAGVCLHYLRGILTQYRLRANSEVTDSRSLEEDKDSGVRSPESGLETKLGVPSCDPRVLPPSCQLRPPRQVQAAAVLPAVAIVVAGHSAESRPPLAAAARPGPPARPTTVSI